MNLDTLEMRLLRLEDIEAIKSITAKYARCVNKGWGGKVVDFDELSSVFTETATWKSDSAHVNVSGISAIVEAIKKSTVEIDFAMHSFTNPIIEVTGDSEVRMAAVGCSQERRDGK